MNDQIKSTVVRSLECRVTHCTEEIEKLERGQYFETRHEWLSYWEGERTAAVGALEAVIAPGFGA